MQKFLEALFIIAKKWKQPIYPSTDKMWCPYSGILIIFKRKVLKHALTWKNLKNIRLSERSQTHMVPFTAGVRGIRQPLPPTM